MRIENNVNGADMTKSGAGIQNRTEETGRDAVKKSKGDGVMVQGDELNLLEDPVVAKRKKAQNLALQLIMEAFKKDATMDQEQKNISEHAKSLEKENEECRSMLKDIDKERQNTAEIYGVDEDSEEYRNLELLRRGREAVTNPDTDMSVDDWVKYKNLEEQGLTDYQKKMLELDENADYYKKKIEENKASIISDYATVRGMKIERLKTHDMRDAVKQGDEIKAAASGEIKGILINEAVENVDQQIEDEKEKAKEKEEKQKELEERIERIKGEEKKEDDHEEIYELDNILNDVKVMNSGNTQPDVSKSLDLIISEMQLIAEDVKGIVIDTEV